MQVLNNAPAFAVWNSYAKNVSQLRGSMSRLSSGLKIENASDDPAGLAVSERLRTQARNSSAAAQNIENSLSYAQTADSWMQKIHDIMGRMGELAVSANDDTKAPTDLGNLQKEFGEMQKEIQRITTGTTAAGKYNGNALFQGEEIKLQVGADYGQTFQQSAINLTTEDATNIGKYGSGSTAVAWGSLIDDKELSIGVQSAAESAVAKLNLGIDYISQKRAVMGAQSARMRHTLEGVRTYESNIRSAESQVRDVDVAKEATNFSKYQILTQVGTAMLAQANALPQGVMQLIG
jgi:flagellin